MPIRALLNTVVALSLFTVAVPAAAQSAMASVQLSVVVPPRAAVTSASAPVARSVSDGLTEYTMQITVNANAPYRVSARRAASVDGEMLVRAADGKRLALSGRDDVVVARGDRGVHTIELIFWVPAERGSASVAAPPTYTVVLEPARLIP